MKQDLFIPVLAGTLLFILLSAFINILILLLQRRRKQHFIEVSTLKHSFEQALLQSQIEVQESTYRHIAQELHDNVGQLLSTTKMLMGVTEIKLGTAPDSLLTANATLSKAIQEVRSLSRSLDKEWLEQFNFLQNLQTEVDKINVAECIKASIQCDGEIQMNSEQQIILFRIVQEGIQNALRHAEPSKLDINISTNHELLRLNIRNNGKPLPEKIEGMGTTNMKHRAKLFGGTVQWKSLETETLVTILIPITKKHEN